MYQGHPTVSTRILLTVLYTTLYIHYYGHGMLHTNIYIYMYIVHVHAYTYIYIYVYILRCMYMYIYVYIYIGYLYKFLFHSTIESTLLHDFLSTSRSHTSENIAFPTPPTTISMGWSPVTELAIRQAVWWRLAGGFGPTTPSLLHCCVRDDHMTITPI